MMTVSGNERRRERRAAAPRATIRVRFSEEEALRHLAMRDISANGIFVHAKQPRTAGTKLQVILTLPNGPELRLLGQVKRVVTAAEATAEQPSGMGIEFFDIPDPVRRQLSEYVSRLERRTAPPEARPVPAPSVHKTQPANKDLRQHIERELDFEMLRRICWVIAEGGILGRPLREVFGVPADAPVSIRREAFERVQRLLEPDRPPAFLGNEEADAVRRTLALLELSLTDE
jgi:Tfp pilus assembly protein PilZ